MHGETLEEWQKLCQQAAREQDFDRLLALAQQINDLLEQKEQRLRGNQQEKAGS